MSTTPTRIVYGKAAADGIGQVLGYAAADSDLTIKAIAEEATTPEDGNTAKVEIYNPGKEATGTLIIPKASLGVGKIGMIVQISYKSAPASFRPYRVTQWDESKDSDTGLAVCQFAAISEDSMVDEYLIGPRDPETGDPIGDKIKVIINWSGAGSSPLAQEGMVFGLFASSVAGPVDHTTEVDKSKAVLADAVSTATMENGQCVFFVAAGTYYISSLAENGQTKAYWNQNSGITMNASLNFYSPSLTQADWYTEE